MRITSRNKGCVCKFKGFKMDSLTRSIERACALHPGIRGVSVSFKKK